jgi:L-threonylcarbamoyladenylate synthase
MIYTPTQAHINAAAELLSRGDLVGMPTETVYGLAANASSQAAVAGIYALKARPADHPVIVHLAPQADWRFWASTMPAYAQSLVNACWPGPLTLVLPRSANVADFITGGQTTVGLRCPSHPVAQALLFAAANRGVQGLAAPSANRYGQVSPTTAAHVEAEFTHPPFTLDGGSCEVGIESTIVDCTGEWPRILRHGAISFQDVSRITGLTVSDGTGTLSGQDAPRVPGRVAAHYAPRTPLAFCELGQAAQLPANTAYLLRDALGVPPAAGVSLIQAPQDSASFARQLYATLRSIDAMGFARIVVQPVPHSDEWAGVADRLSRAAASFAA